MIDIKRYEPLTEIRRRVVYALAHWNRIDYLIKDTPRLDLPRFGGSSGSRVLMSHKDLDACTVHFYWIQLREGGELRPNWIEAVERHYIDGWTLAATAQRLGCKEGTVKRYLDHAVSALTTRIYEQQPRPNTCPLCFGSIVLDYNGDEPALKCVMCGRSVARIKICMACAHLVPNSKGYLCELGVKTCRFLPKSA